MNDPAMNVPLPLRVARGLQNTFRTPEQIALDEKRARALEYLGTKWILHPDNRIQKRTPRGGYQRSPS